MSKEKIRALLSSEQNNQEIANQLIEIYSANPPLLGATTILKRTVFHDLVLKNKVEILERLLSQEQFREPALLGDIKGNTCLHYVVVKEKEDSQDAFNVLVKYGPEGLLNKTNNQGNTPLHAAVIANNHWAVQSLIKLGKVNRSLKNSQGNTVFDLAKNNSELMRLLCESQCLDLRSRVNSSPESFDSTMEFYKFFPLLSKRRNAYSAGPGYLPRLQSCEPSDKDFLDSNDRVQAPISSHEFTSTYQELVVAFKVNRNSEDCKRALAKFCSLCQHYFLENYIKEFAFNFPERVDLLNSILAQLSQQLDEYYSFIQEKNYKLVQNFIELLTRANIFAVERVIAFPKIEEITADERVLLEFLWHLTLSQEDYENPCREFSFKKITERTLGALTSFPINELLLGIRRLEPYFDTQQKLAANYIVWQLFNYHIIDRVFPQEKQVLQVRIFIKKNLKLGKLGNEINEHFRILLALNTIAPSQILLKNFNLLKEQFRKEEKSKEKTPFSELVAIALAKSRQDRAKEVQMIAHELRMLTLTFYQNVRLSEFGNGNWSKPDKEKLSNNIVRSTRFFNKLSEFFIEKILLQPKNNIRNALQLIIELVKELGPLEGELYPDLNQLMMLSSVLNAAEISRLTEVFNSLPEEDLHLKTELDQLLSRDKNSKWMREVYRLYRSTLPYLGNILTDLTFAYDGNPFPILRAEAMGSILLGIMETKLLVNYELVIYHTDLQNFLYSFQELDRELFYYQSLKLQPRKNDLLNLDEEKDFQMILESLQDQYLSGKILPPTMFNKERHLPNQLAINLLLAFENQLKKSPTKLRPVLPLLKQIIRTIIEINHNYYYPARLTDYFNPLFYLNQINELAKENLDSDRVLSPRSHTIALKRRSAPKTFFSPRNTSEKTVGKGSELTASRSHSFGV